MRIILHTDAEGPDLVDMVESALPTHGAILLLLHLRLLRSPDGQAVIAMLGASGRTFFVADEVVRYTQADGTHDTCAMLGVTTEECPQTQVSLDAIAPEFWMQIWPSDRPLPTPEMSPDFVPVADLDD